MLRRRKENRGDWKQGAPGRLNISHEGRQLPTPQGLDQSVFNATCSCHHNLKPETVTVKKINIHALRFQSSSHSPDQLQTRKWGTILNSKWRPWDHASGLCLVLPGTPAAPSPGTWAHPPVQEIADAHTKSIGLAITQVHSDKWKVKMWVYPNIRNRQHLISGCSWWREGKLPQT